jgi:hypothetical protein
VDDISKVIEWLSTLPRWLIMGAMALEEFYRWGGLAATVIARIGLALPALAGAPVAIAAGLWSRLAGIMGYIVGVGAQLGSGLAQIDSLAEAGSRILGAEQLFEATRRGLVQQAGSVWVEMQAYEEQLPDLTEVARQNEEIVASFIRQYIAGRKTWLDVLNSERELTQSRLTLADTRAATVSAQSRMARLAGLIRFDAASGEQQ